MNQESVGSRNQADVNYKNKNPQHFFRTDLIAKTDPKKIVSF